jgi:hypothetical protein
MWLGFIVVLVITLPAILVMRRVLARRVAAMMLRASPSAVDGHVFTSPDEVGAAALLGLDRMDASAAPRATPDITTASSARFAFRLWWSADVLAALVILVGGGGGLALAYLLLLPLRYAYHVRLVRQRRISGFRRPGFFRRWVTMLFEQLVAMFFQPRYAWFPLPMLAVFAAAVNIAALPAAVAGLAVFVLLRRVAVRRMQAEPNRRLLILRVFGRDENTDLTFGALRRAWQHLGTSFTVVDRSYIGFKYRGHSEDHVALVFLACTPVLVLATAGQNPPTLEVWGSLGAVIGLVLVVGYGIAMAVLFARAPRYFAADQAQIGQMIDGVLQRPRSWSFGFRDLDMYCFDNTWRLAVTAFIANTDVVLMDLRGYAASNTGCDEEIDRLFDTVPVGRIVLLVDSRNDTALTDRMLQARWRMLDRHSPNLSLGDPRLTIVRIQDEADADVNGLVQALVVASAGGRSGSAPSARATGLLAAA